MAQAKIFQAIVCASLIGNLLFSYATPALAQTRPGQTGFNYATDAGVSKTIKEFLCAPTEPGQVSSNNTGGTAATTGNTAANDLNECINKLYRFTIAIASVIAVFFIVIGGYIYMSAGGNQESVDKAKNILETSVASLVILFGAYVLLRAINPDLIRIPSIQPPEVKYAGQLKYEDFVLMEMPDGTTVRIPRSEATSNENCVFRTEQEARTLMQTFGIRVWNLSGTAKVTKNVNLTLHKDVVGKMKTALEEVYGNPEKFPIYSIAGYNYRAVQGTRILSAHSCGIAIDINPNENAYIKDGKVLAGQFWRPCPGANCSPYSIPSGGSVVQAMAKQGFAWGGNFQSSKDYMHFSCSAAERGSCPKY